MSAIARIISINAPSAARAGTYVLVEAILQNAGDAPGWIVAIMEYWEPQPPAGWSQPGGEPVWLEPGATAVFPYTFIMTTWPGATGTSVRITAYHSVENAEGGYDYIRDEQRTIAIAIGTPPSLAGQITNLLYWYDGLATWVDLVAGGAPTVPPGTRISLLVGWVNRSTVAITGHIDLIVSKPDGSQVTPVAVAGQDWRANPGTGGTVQFAPVTLDQVGAWQAQALLNAV